MFVNLICRAIRAVKLAAWNELIAGGKIKYPVLLQGIMSISVAKNED